MNNNIQHRMRPMGLGLGWEPKATGRLLEILAMRP